MKLVRDKIPEIISQDGATVFYKIVKNHDELRHFMLQKVEEEINELKATLVNQDKNSFIEELVDVLEILEAVGKHIYGFDNNFWDEVFREKVDKKTIKGSFDKRIILINTRKGV